MIGEVDNKVLRTYSQTLSQAQNVFERMLKSDLEVFAIQNANLVPRYLQNTRSG